MTEDIYTKDLRKANGDVFCEIKRSADNSFIYVNWIGIQSIETMVMGWNQVLIMLRKKPCSAILNSNREMIGPWEAAVSWLANKWAPQAKALGVTYFAHVLSHGIFGKRSFEKLKPEFEKIFKMRFFEDEDLAEKWIRFNVA